MKKIIQREIEVAFSKHAQPVWFRIIKWIVLLAMIYFFRNSSYFWETLLAAVILGFAVHFFWRYKTNGWTRSWYGWNYEMNIPKEHKT